ncbi:MAG: 3-isopropylmalate dehydratase small subunit [Armatimonadetes bacterium]|nr:3-isopropylmalate dehydratase small subunit [Armatimonadota bacterium]
MAGLQFHEGRIAVYNSDNVDTDRIIPARFLSRISKLGYGELLFSDVRGPEFFMDQPEAAGATVLVAGTNFGCGSSREHAVWAIQQGGFIAVIALKTETSPGYSDIFRQNSANCGLLLIELPAPAHSALVAAGTGATVAIDVAAQTVILGDQKFEFEISPASKDQILKGQDLIGTTLEFESAIGGYEANMNTFVGK